MTPKSPPKPNINEFFLLLFFDFFSLSRLLTGTSLTSSPGAGDLSGEDSGVSLKILATRRRRPDILRAILCSSDV